MKTIILSIALITLTSCGKKNNRVTKFNTPVYGNPVCRYPNVNTLDYKCSKSGGAGQFRFDCYNRIEKCSLNFGRYINTWRCYVRGEE